MKPRTEANLPDSIQRQLNMYALAASAAGVGLLALAQSAEAKIVYTKTHQTIQPNTQYNLDLNGDGTTDFTLSNYRYYKSSLSAGAGLFVAIPQGNFVRGYVVSSGERFGSAASALAAGVKIQGKRKFLPKLCQKSCRGTMFRSDTNPSSGASALGQWSNATNRYLGLKFKITGQTHYGWARLNTSCPAFKYQCSALLTGYAYETVANKGIVTGKTHGADVITREQSSLGHLAQGALAIRRWRLRKAIAACE